jgi:hypothetical protein
MLSVSQIESEAEERTHHRLKCIASDDPLVLSTISAFRAIEAAVKADCEKNEQVYSKITDELIRFRVHQVTRMYAVTALTKIGEEERIERQADREEARELREENRRRVTIQATPQQGTLPSSSYGQGS